VRRLQATVAIRFHRHLQAALYPNFAQRARHQFSRPFRFQWRYLPESRIEILYFSWRESHVKMDLPEFQFLYAKKHDAPLLPARRGGQSYSIAAGSHATDQTAAPKSDMLQG